MKYKNLGKEDYDIIRKAYSDYSSKKEAQQALSKQYGVARRTIRRWANKLGLNVMKYNIENPSGIMIYDIETSRVTAKLWWTGKQYVNHTQLVDEPKIISVAYKWLGDDKIHILTWDKNHDDKMMMTKFMKEYNKANLVIGQNNDRFDNRWVNARALKYGIDVNTHVRSLDLMKETKRLFRLPSYSMKYIAEFLDLPLKGEHEGMKMWEMVESGTSEQQSEYLEKMKSYNIQDVVVTEEMYLKLKKYMGHKIHLGVLNGEARYTCPNCGSSHIGLYKTTVTPAGTIQRIMQCKQDETKYKISNKQYMNFLEYKMKNNIK